MESQKYKFKCFGQRKKENQSNRKEKKKKIGKEAGGGEGGNEENEEKQRAPAYIRQGVRAGRSDLAWGEFTRFPERNPIHHLHANRLLRLPVGVDALQHVELVQRLPVPEGDRRPCQPARVWVCQLCIRNSTKQGVHAIRSCLLYWVY